MVANGYAIFLINLLQDVNIVRPLVFMAARDLGLRTEFLVSKRFLRRDNFGIWQKELAEIGEATATPIISYENELDAFRHLEKKSGALVAASESSLSAHTPNNEIFRCAPRSFLTITLQHGFECVGFLQSHDHDLAHGREVTFFADVVCGWCDGSRLTSMAPSQRPKLYVSGPPTVLQTRRRAEEATAPNDNGLVCENMHSVRLRTAGDFTTEFISIFHDFCAALAVDRRKVTLRPHPGGQYVLKKWVEIPRNVMLNNHPMYKVDLTQFAYGITPPSSIAIDLVLAGVPVAVWRDGSGVMDAGNYDGLTQISSLGDWLDFSREAVAHPERFLEPQRRFLEQQRMPVDPEDVYQRFAKLLSAAAGEARSTSSVTVETERVMFVTNGTIPTLQLSFTKPLAPFVESGEFVTDFVTEQELLDTFGKSTPIAKINAWLEQRLLLFRPTLLVFCRYSGRHASFLVAWARREGVPIIFHVDDDLLNVPKELGKDKHRAHNHPSKLGSVRHLLGNADLVYCSTEPLKQRFRSIGVATPMISGAIYCSGDVLAPAVHRPARKVGYMGFDHAHDLAPVVPAIVDFMRRNQDVMFELFGSIPKPPALNEFGDRVTVLPPIRDYHSFMTEFATRQWDIGICPLTISDFNMVKADTKWVEYTSVGAAVIASRGTIYDRCCADGCGILAQTPDEWLDALERLFADDDERFAQVTRAQQKLKESYSVEALRRQVLDVFAHVRMRLPKRQRIMFVSTGHLPTLQLSFIKPLAPLIEAGNIVVDYLTVEQMKELSARNPPQKVDAKWVTERLRSFNPNLLVMCRYNGPHAKLFTDWATKESVPVIFHIDDDLLNIPRDIGAEKYDYHNRSPRLASVRHFLDKADLVYCSTKELKERLQSQGIGRPLFVGDIYCSGEVLAPPVKRAARKFGYMASVDHAHNFGMILPAIIAFMRRNPDMRFELFGSISQPARLEEFGDRVVMRPPVKNYRMFLQELANAEWDIGICPLQPIAFNLVKANTKWVEYTSAGMAVVASRGTVYDDCCADGCGVLADTTDEWLAGLERLAHDAEERYAHVIRAQAKIRREYSIERLRGQVLDVFDHADGLMATRGMT